MRKEAEENDYLVDSRNQFKGAFKFSRQYVTPWCLVVSKHFIGMYWLHLLGQLTSFSKPPVTSYQTVWS